MALCEFCDREADYENAPMVVNNRLYRDALCKHCLLSPRELQDCFAEDSIEYDRLEALIGQYETP